MIVYIAVHCVEQIGIVDGIAVRFADKIEIVDGIAVFGCFVVTWTWEGSIAGKG